MRKAARRRQRDEHDRDITLAWHVVAIELQAKAAKRLMPLGQLLRNRPAHAVPQSVSEQRMVIEDLSKRYGMKVYKGRRRKGRVIRFMDHDG